MLVRLDDEPEVVALIPTLANDLARLSACVDATARQATARRLAVVCIVNAPLAPPFDDRPAEVTVIEAGLNLGWAGALSFARTLVSSPYLWLVQDDMRAEPECLEELFEGLAADPRRGLVSPIAIGVDGRVPKGSCGGFLDGEGVIQSWYPVDDTALDDLDRVASVSFAPSRGSLVRATAWDAVGGMDPRQYPLGWGDVDFCYALKRGGYEFAMVTAARVAHDGHGSTTNDYIAFLSGRNAELFGAKWYPDSRAPRNPVAPPNRPTPPHALTGHVHPAIDRALLATVAQAAADTLLHLARNYTADPRPPEPPRRRGRWWRGG